MIEGKKLIIPGGEITLCNGENALEVLTATKEDDKVLGEKVYTQMVACGNYIDALCKLIPTLSVKEIAMLVFQGFRVFYHHEKGERENND